MNLDDRALVDRFLDMMAAEAGASRNTLTAYRTDLERTINRRKQHRRVAARFEQSAAIDLASPVVAAISR